MKRIEVFTQPGCPPCSEVKAWLKRHGQEFTERNIREDAAALQELVAGGFKATPVTMIDGQPVAGFNPAELERLLATPQPR
ncbi:MAG TPA: glutaredoxin family protein [Herpetosiphonaceae bacterium]